MDTITLKGLYFCINVWREGKNKYPECQWFHLELMNTVFPLTCHIFRKSQESTNMFH